MKKHRQSAILIQTETGDDIGIVTDYDISHRFVAEKMAPETPVYQIMSSPIISVPDNAIIYEDVEEDKKEETEAYFLSLGEKVCKDLDQAGYRLCEGEIMAMNPKWCQPLSAWKNYFSQWISEATAQNLLDIRIFFDFRNLYGTRRLTSR